jgi:hypothetical protein
MWGIIEKIKMFGRLTKSVIGGCPGRVSGLFEWRSGYYGYRHMRV